MKKHKKDILKNAAELLLKETNNLPEMVKSDIDLFIAELENDPFDDNSLKNYGLKNEEVIAVLKKVYNDKK